MRSLRPLAGCLLFLAFWIPAERLGAQERPPIGKPGPPPNDLQSVERLLAARKEYQRALENLREFYRSNGDPEKARWVEEELLGFHRISKPAYRLDLDVPPPTLQAQFNIPEANELFRRAITFKNKSWFSGEYEDNLRRAEILFQQLLTTYPSSDKISSAAYHLGDIYESRVFKQPRRAAQYYERCFQWNSHTDTDARFRAAKLYDRTLNERGKAVQLYREVINHDSDPKRVEEARKRLSDLSGGMP
jgi:tetratricopeptide (TPR) repeat protein